MSWNNWSSFDRSSDANNGSVFNSSSYSSHSSNSGGNFTSFEPFTSSFSQSGPSYSSQPQSLTMSNSNKPFYITSVSNGHVLSNQSNNLPSGVVAENRGDQGDEEKWTLEAGDEPNVIALKNASNGKYLHANGGGSWSTVGTGEKQWWRLSNDELSPPGACRLSPVPYPGVFLNHFQGQAARKGAVGIKVHMWQWEGVCIWEHPSDGCIALTDGGCSMCRNGSAGTSWTPTMSGSTLWRQARCRRQVLIAVLPRLISTRS